MASDRQAAQRYIAQNRQARHDFFIEEVVEAGLMLTGTEVKSLRGGRATISESHAADRNGELWLLNSYIPAYENAHPNFNHEPRRPRKLLLRSREMNKLMGARQREGMALIPLGIYFNDRGIAKLELGLAKGKKKYDKRETEKKRDWDREKQRLLKAGG